jgi:DNA-binding MarR family transcriptional regulator
MVLDRHQSAGYLTNWCARLFARELERQLAPHGLMPAYMPVLFALADEGSMTPKRLAERAAVEQPTMTATLNRMMRDGLIAREPNPEDGRSTLIALTGQGLARLPVVEQVTRATNEIALEQLEPEERQQFLRLLRQVVGVLEVQAGRPRSVPD